MFARALVPVRAQEWVGGAAAMALQIALVSEEYVELGETEVDLDTVVLTGELLGRRDVHQLLPFEEREICLRADRCIFVPFGSRESGLRAAEVALPLAEHLGMKVLFYHTTWRQPGLDSSIPDAHMCEDAKGILEQLKKMGHEGQVAFEYQIELAADVLEGIILAALVHKASLIVTARGTMVRIGSYAERLGRGPVPVLICAQEEGS